MYDLGNKHTAISSFVQITCKNANTINELAQIFKVEMISPSRLV